MSYSESDRVKLRHYVGFGAIFLQADPRLESAISATQSIADGGTRPDASTETYIKSLVTDLDALEARMKTKWTAPEAGTVDEIGVDFARGLATLRFEGRRLCNSLARMLGMRGVRADIFSAAPVIDDEYPFA